MAKRTNSSNMKPRLGFKLFFAYVKGFFKHIYLRKLYSLGWENIPKDCPLMIVSDHQNTATDALGFIFSIRNRRNRKTKTVIRADVFYMPVINIIARWIGLIPAYRMMYEGADSLSKNTTSIVEISDELLNNGTVVLFPEAGHQEKHWLGRFSLAYLRFCFETAKSVHFEKEIYLLPSCNHYSDYAGLQEDMIVRFGTPVPLSPYYELYKTKPWTAQRQVNAAVRQQISDMMLNITDEDNYTAFDYLRNTYGIRYAADNGFNPTYLPDKLEADKQLFARLEAAKETQKAEVQQIYDHARQLEQTEQQYRFKNTEKERHIGQRIATGAVMLALFPLFVIALIPNVFIFGIPALVKRKFKDMMFHGTVYFVLNILIILPLTSIAVFRTVYVLCGHWLPALIAVLCIPLLNLFAVYYNKQLRHDLNEYRYRRLLRKGKINTYVALKEQLYRTLDKMVG
ncbi:MAG: 1-acyl-sn-glycerol-3-phosphate acyltransferase [Bacteroidales bacterium]|jgi:1-acyl-sn-glycerol-3-phosphate acyltransferase|nr:1-acyl-sn-glycerol-3-phosphate acyltransferase [Bacteroidales bacterium]